MTEQDSGAGRGNTPTRHPRALMLFGLTFAILLQELILIRWLPGQVRVLAYFPNLVLIAAFLGLGVGCLRAAATPRLWLWPFSVLVIVAAAAMASGVAFTDSSETAHLWLLYYDLPEGAPVVQGVSLPVFIAFVLCSVSFMVPGQILAQQLDGFAQKGRPLTGYAVDLGGSLAGVVMFAILAWQETFPIVWFAALTVIMLAVIYQTPRSIAVHAAMLAAVLGAVQLVEKANFYSPYYALRGVERTADSLPFVSTNGSLHQVPADVERSSQLTTELENRIRAGFHIPYDLLGREPKRALVLGAGTGNDVSVLLDRGATHVDAVEIDPVIFRIGETLHPNRPYDSPRVTRINTDARSHLNTTDARYDMIVFGTLDSLTRLSALSNVRLDNFVYTEESLRTAYSRLTDDGGMVLYFMVGAPYIAAHLNNMLTRATGEPPTHVAFNNGLFSVVYMVGPAFEHLRTSNATTSPESSLILDVPTDDWPHLYLEHRGVGSFYRTLILAIAVFSIIAVFAASSELRNSLRQRRGIDVEMFLFGFGFLLLETRFVTGVGLLWGVTWIASAVVFAAILATMLLATLVVARRPMPWHVASGGLVAALCLVWALPPGALLTTSLPVKLALTTLYVGVPVFLASTCFALRFRTRVNAGAAFGWNLLGAVCGGLAEFLSMALGFRALFMVTLAIYLLAFLYVARDGRKSTA